MKFRLNAPSTKIQYAWLAQWKGIYLRRGSQCLFYVYYI